MKTERKNWIRSTTAAAVMRTGWTLVKTNKCAVRITRRLLYVVVRQKKYVLARPKHKIKENFKIKTTYYNNKTCA